MKLKIRNNYTIATNNSVNFINYYISNNSYIINNSNYRYLTKKFLNKKATIFAFCLTFTTFV